MENLRRGMPSLEGGSVQPEQSIESDNFSREEMLNLSPAELPGYLTKLADEGKLDSFLEKALSDESIVAQLSYWEKWLTKDQRRIVEDIIERKKESYPGNSESLPLELDKRFTEKELRLIFSNVETIQLTFGCSKGCPFCGFDAIKGVREHIPYAQLANMFQKYGKELSIGQPFLYWASEPSDYASKEGIKDRTYEDVHQLAVQYAHYDPHITSFNITDQKWLDFMAASNVLRAQSGKGVGGRRLSMYGMNRKTWDRVADMTFGSARKADPDFETHSSIRFVQLTPPGDAHLGGMGTHYNAEEDDAPVLKSGIACVDGVLLSPRGIYNLVVVPISKEYPQGVIIEPIHSIEDADVKEGNNIKDIMRKTVIEGAFAFQGEYKQGDTYQRHIGSFPKNVYIHTASAQYMAAIEKDGTMDRARKVIRCSKRGPLEYLLLDDGKTVKRLNKTRHKDNQAFD